MATTSAVQTVTLSDPSGAPFSVTNIVVSGAYTQTNNCITKLLPGQDCTINVTFAPAAVGASNGMLTLTDTTRTSPQVIPLTGTGVNGPFLQLSPAHMTFTSTAVGSTSASQSVMLTNTGNATLTITNIAFAGGNAGDFSESNSCGGSVAPRGKCSVSVTFTPTASGTRVAALTITDSATGSPQMVNLSGTSLGSQVMLSPASLTFAARATGTTSASQSVALTNSGGAPLSVTMIASPGDFAQTNNCGTLVAAGVRVRSP